MICATAPASTGHMKVINNHRPRVTSAAVAAVIAGVPVFTLADCCATIMGRKSVAQIEDPLYPDDRERWLSVLAANQWSVDELRDGTCWRALQESRELVDG